jgi:hypothetical protein
MKSLTTLTAIHPFTRLYLEKNIIQLLKIYLFKFEINIT